MLCGSHNASTCLATSVATQCYAAVTMHRHVSRQVLQRNAMRQSQCIDMSRDECCNAMLCGSHNASTCFATSVATQCYAAVTMHRHVSRRVLQRNAMRQSQCIDMFRDKCCNAMLCGSHNASTCLATSVATQCY